MGAKDQFPLPLPFVKPEAKEIDLPSAFRLAGVENPDIYLARQRVIEAVAIRQLAAAQFLPNLNMGGNYDAHLGVLQQSSGNILKTNRDALYLGMGTYAVAAGTVSVPGIHVGRATSRIPSLTSWSAGQRDRVSRAESIAVRNDVLLRVASAYVQLLRAECRLVIALQIRFETAQVARITAAYARTGQGTAADADRAATDLGRRDNEILQAQNEVLVASAQLAELLNLDPSLRLHAIDGWVVPAPIVPPPDPAWRVACHRPACSGRNWPRAGPPSPRRFFPCGRPRSCRSRPTSSSATATAAFGGGSNLVAQPGGFGGSQASRFDSFGGREDSDIILYWTAQNLGVGNVAQIKAARSNLSSANLEQVIVLNQVRSQVATAYANTLSRFALIGVTENAVRTGSEAFQEDLTRIRGAQGRPIEVLDSIRLLADARYSYLDAICDYNRRNLPSMSPSASRRPIVSPDRSHQTWRRRRSAPVLRVARLLRQMG